MIIAKQIFILVFKIEIYPFSILNYVRLYKRGREGEREKDRERKRMREKREIKIKNHKGRERNLR